MVTIFFRRIRTLCSLEDMQAIDGIPGTNFRPVSNPSHELRQGSQQSLRVEGAWELNERQDFARASTTGAGVSALDSTQREVPERITPANREVEVWTRRDFARTSTEANVSTVDLTQRVISSSVTAANRSAGQFEESDSVAAFSSQRGGTISPIEIGPEPSLIFDIRGPSPREGRSVERWLPPASPARSRGADFGLRVQSGVRRIFFPIRSYPAEIESNRWWSWKFLA